MLNISKNILLCYNICPQSMISPNIGFSYLEDLKRLTQTLRAFSLLICPFPYTIDLRAELIERNHTLQGIQC